MGMRDKGWVHLESGGDLRRYGSAAQCGILIWILNQEKSTDVNISENQRAVS
jgi:hypothetical protein